MASQLLSDIRDQTNHEVSIDLIVGMTGVDGISIDTHRGFESLQEHPPFGRLSVKYIPIGHEVHSKLYIWLDGDQPKCAFAGSSNFTHNGFLLGQRGHSRDELLVTVPPDEAIAEFRRIEANSISIDHSELLNEVRITRSVRAPEWSEPASDNPEVLRELVGYKSVILPLIMLGGPRASRGQIHGRSGLNWGQRPDQRREPNQAYIPIPRKIARLGFFPPRGVQFLVNTDDNRAIIMVVAEDGDKALHSPQGNQLIGEYFRNRLGVANGVRITLDDLRRFGSRFVRFYKSDDENYIMEFSPDVEADGATFYNV